MAADTPQFDRIIVAGFLHGRWCSRSILYSADPPKYILARGHNVWMANYPPVVFIAIRTSQKVFPAGASSGVSMNLSLKPACSSLSPSLPYSLSLEWFRQSSCYLARF